MTALVVLVLVVLWVAVLAPRAVRRLREVRSQTSIESFHEQLHLLERAGPKLVEPAYRLGAPVVPLRPRNAPAGPAVDTTGGGRAAVGDLGVTPDRAYGGLRLLDDSMTGPGEGRRRTGPQPSAQQRRRGRRRRRDILLGLGVTALLTGVVGSMHSLHVLWAVTAISVVAIAGYVALAAYVQMLDAEHHALKPIVTGPPERLPSPWADARPRHAPGEPLPGVEVLTAPASWAAKAGYPGAWDDDSVMARHAATGG